MVNDVVTPSDPLVALIEKEELEEASLDVNIFQWSREKEPSRKVVCTQVDRSAWDHWLSPNPHALTIYLKFVPTYGVVPKMFEKCQCEDDEVHFHCRKQVLDDGHYHWLWNLINPLSMEHRTKYLARTICRILDFLQLWSIPSQSFTKL